MRVFHGLRQMNDGYRFITYSEEKYGFIAIEINQLCLDQLIKSFGQMISCLEEKDAIFHLFSFNNGYVRYRYEQQPSYG